MPQEQPYVFELRPDSLKLQWRSVELPSRITDYSPVTYRLEIQESPRSEWMTLAKGIPHTDFHVTNLNPDKDYRFRVRAENDMGISDPTPEVPVKKRAGKTICTSQQVIPFCSVFEKFLKYFNLSVILMIKLFPDQFLKEFLKCICISRHI